MVAPHTSVCDRLGQNYLKKKFKLFIPFLLIREDSDMIFFLYLSRYQCPKVWESNTFYWKLNTVLLVPMYLY